MNLKPVLFASVVILLLTANAKAEEGVHKDFRLYFNGLCDRESSNKPLPKREDTDGKLVIGFVQAKYAFWKDASEFDTDLGGSWERMEKDREYCYRVVIAYYKRYCPKALASGNWENLARVHNGGPAGANKKYKKIYAMTTKYWNDIKANLRKAGLDV